VRQECRVKYKTFGFTTRARNKVIKMRKINAQNTERREHEEDAVLITVFEETAKFRRSTKFLRSEKAIRKSEIAHIHRADPNFTSQCAEKYGHLRWCGELGDQTGLEKGLKIDNLITTKQKRERSSEKNRRRESKRVAFSGRETKRKLHRNTQAGEKAEDRKRLKIVDVIDVI
jgi:hypothetical protein